MINYNHLLELNNLANREISNYPKKRDLFYELQKNEGRHFVGITGPRGVGKTIILKQLAANFKNAFYLSLDVLDEGDLFEITKHLNQKFGYTTFLYDEIHYQKNYQQQLKKIYDFLEIKLIFTSSVSLSLYDAANDLSRRVQLLNLYPFCFREFIHFRLDKKLPSLTLKDIIIRNWTPDHLRHEFLFEEYIQGELMPFMLEESSSTPIMKNILNKIIQKDIPSFARLETHELLLLEKTVKFIGSSSVDGINYSSISRNIGITKYKSEAYLNLLKKAFVLQIVFPAGTNVLKEPKVLMHLPYRLIYQSYDQAVGGIREDFAIEMLMMRGFSPCYLKSTRGAKTPDFLVEFNQDEKMVIEIGGRRKGREQFKGITVDKKIIFTQPGVIDKIKRPLFLLGFLGNQN